MIKMLTKYDEIINKIQQNVYYISVNCLQLACTVQPNRVATCSLNLAVFLHAFTSDTGKTPLQ